LGINSEERAEYRQNYVFYQKYGGNKSAAGISLDYTRSIWTLRETTLFTLLIKMKLIEKVLSINLKVLKSKDFIKSCLVNLGSKVLMLLLTIQIFQSG
jgi:hypothetical protein